MRSSTRTGRGCQWEFLPHDMPPPGAVKFYFYCVVLPASAHDNTAGIALLGVESVRGQEFGRQPL